MVSCRSPTSELLRQVLHHPDEKLLQEFFQTALSAVRSMVCVYISVSHNGFAGKIKKIWGPVLPFVLYSILLNGSVCFTIMSILLYIVYIHI